MKARVNASRESPSSPTGPQGSRGPRPARHLMTGKLKIVV